VVVVSFAIDIDIDNLKSCAHQVENLHLRGKGSCIVEKTDAVHALGTALEAQLLAGKRPNMLPSRRRGAPQTARAFCIRNGQQPFTYSS
jgi:hypothetical protein